MLMKQPFFILGIANVEEAKSSAFGAAGAFLFTFTLSIGYLIHDARQLKSHAQGTATRNLGFMPSPRGEYGQVPLQEMDDHEHEEGTFT